MEKSSNCFTACDSAVTHKYNPGIIGIEKFDAVYTDPPWGNGMIKIFNKKCDNGGNPPDVGFENLIGSFLYNVLPYVKSDGYVLIEMGNRWVNTTIDLMTKAGIDVYELIPVLYRSGAALKPSTLIVGRLGAPGVSFNSVTGLNGLPEVIEVLNILPGYNFVDPFMGVGLFGVGAKITGKSYYGIELSRERFTKATTKIARYESHK